MNCRWFDLIFFALCIETVVSSHGGHRRTDTDTVAHDDLNRRTGITGQRAGNPARQCILAVGGIIPACGVDLALAGAARGEADLEDTVRCCVLVEKFVALGPLRLPTRPSRALVSRTRNHEAANQATLVIVETQRHTSGALDRIAKRTLRRSIDYFLPAQLHPLFARALLAVLKLRLAYPQANGVWHGSARETALGVAAATVHRIAVVTLFLDLDNRVSAGGQIARITYPVAVLIRLRRIRAMRAAVGEIRNTIAIGIVRCYEHQVRCAKGRRRTIPISGTSAVFDTARAIRATLPWRTVNLGRTAAPLDDLPAAACLTHEHTRSADTTRWVEERIPEARYAHASALHDRPDRRCHAGDDIEQLNHEVIRVAIVVQIDPALCSFQR